MLHNTFCDCFGGQQLKCCVGQQFFFCRVIDKSCFYKNSWRFCAFQDIPLFHLYASIGQTICGNQLLLHSLGQWIAGA